MAMRWPVRACEGTALRRAPAILPLLALLSGFLGGCTGGGGPAPADTAAPLRVRIAALALRQIEFGSLSLIPVRFEKSRLSGPFEDGGRTLYCVTSHMTGRSFGKYERAKAVIRDDGGTLRVLPDEDEVCEGHRAQPFPELEAAGNPAG